MKIYFARHGRTNYNDLELCNADPTVDVHITATGIEQAKALAEKLKDVPLDHIFTSELKRTQQTAEIVNQFHNAPVEIDPLLNDHRSGYEGKSASLLIKAMDTADDKWSARFNGGESIEDVKQRMRTFLEKVRRQPYETVLVVSHGWVIHTAIAIIKDIPNEEAWKIDPKQGDFLEFEIGT